MCLVEASVYPSHSVGVHAQELMDEAAIDNAVAHSQRLHPSATFSKQAPNVYEVNGRRVELLLDRGAGLVAVDGPLRQPLADYIVGSGYNETWTDGQFEQSALHSIPLASRVSFEEVFPVNRAEAMALALQEAELREQHAQQLSSSFNSSDISTRPPQETIRPQRIEGMTTPFAPHLGVRPRVDFVSAQSHSIVVSPVLSHRGLLGINGQPLVQTRAPSASRSPSQGSTANAIARSSPMRNSGARNATPLQLTPSILAEPITILAEPVKAAPPIPVVQPTTPRKLADSRDSGIWQSAARVGCEPWPSPWQLESPNPSIPLRSFESEATGVRVASSSPQKRVDHSPYRRLEHADVQLTPGSEHRPTRGGSPSSRLRGFSPTADPTFSPPASPQRQPPRPIVSASVATRWASPQKISRPMSPASSSRSVASPQQRYRPMRSSSAPSLLDRSPSPVRGAPTPLPAGSISSTTINPARIPALSARKAIVRSGSSARIPLQVPLLSSRTNSAHNGTQDQRLNQSAARPPIPKPLSVQAAVSSSQMQASAHTALASVIVPPAVQDGFHSPAPRRSAFRSLSPLHSSSSARLSSSPHPKRSAADPVGARNVRVNPPSEATRAEDLLVLIATVKDSFSSVQENLSHRSPHVTARASLNSPQATFRPTVPLPSASSMTAPMSSKKIPPGIPPSPVVRQRSVRDWIDAEDRLQ